MAAYLTMHGWLPTWTCMDGWCMGSCLSDHAWVASCLSTLGVEHRPMPCALPVCGALPVYCLRETENTANGFHKAHVRPLTVHNKGMVSPFTDGNLAFRRMRRDQL
jgi:hypothetical protein